MTERLTQFLIEFQPAIITGIYVACLVIIWNQNKLINILKDKLKVKE